MDTQTEFRHADLLLLGLQPANIFRNLPPAELTEHVIQRDEGVLTSTGAIACSTGHFTGRSPDDRFFVLDDITRDSVNWGCINHPIEEKYFDGIFNKMIAFSEGKDLYVRDSFVCADPEYSINLRIVSSYAFHSLFCYNMFLRHDSSSITNDNPEYTIICFPDFEADPLADGVKSKNFVAISMSKKIVLIGGTAYTGEIKKSVFSILNFLLPHYKKVLSMHTSANVGKNGDSALFFGLSGTGKTTLSADPERYLIGDDEHGWDDKGIFNFEGGCYAKVINLEEEEEPQIFGAIKFGAVLENTRFNEATREVNFSDSTITQNTRVSYPVDYIPHAVSPSMGPVPSNIFFLTADAFGVLPPVSKLTPAQAQFHFISGYTAKVAGTEEGVNQPKPVFSACFGEPFMPLHASEYAKLLGEKIKKHNVNVWLINTGWSGGAYGKGARIPLKYTRAIISAILNGSISKSGFQDDPIFGISVPEKCENVPTEILIPEKTWSDKKEFVLTANKLVEAFLENFSKYKIIDPEILEVLPKRISLP